MDKVVKTLREAIQLCGLEDGMTVSFHHHLRNGDYVLNMAMDEIAAMGIKGLTVNASSFFDCHAPLAGHIQSGVVRKLQCNYMSSVLGRQIVNGLMAMYDDEEAFAEFIEAYADYRIEQFEYIKKYLDVDFMMMHDDWGNQNNMFFSPEMWRKFFKEPERRMVKRCQELGMHYMHHSCGYIEPIIPDLVEIGVESWHGGAPVNNLKKIKAEYGDKLIFAGGVDPQVTDTGKATEEEIRAEVRRVIDTLGKGGGLMISSAVMFSTVPGVDITVDDETAKYGRYDTLKFD